MKQSKPIRLTGNFVETPTEQTYHCENCNVEFPIEDERYGLCRECNEGNGFCYECEKKDDKIFELKSLNISDRFLLAPSGSGFGPPFMYIYSSLPNDSYPSSAATLDVP